MAFKIEIIRIEKEKFEDQEYKQVADTGNERDSGPVYEYVPSGTKIREIETTILEQTVEELDLHSVIRAINGL